MSQLLEEQQKQEKVQNHRQHQLSDVFLNATEKQCSYLLCKESIDGTKEYCAVGLMGLYSGNNPNTYSDFTTKVYGKNNERSLVFSSYSKNDSQYAKTYKFYGLDPDKIYGCPACNKKERLGTILPHLNNERIDFDCTNRDSHGWTFKQIGEWLKEIGH